MQRMSLERLRMIPTVYRQFRYWPGRDTVDFPSSDKVRLVALEDFRP